MSHDITEETLEEGRSALYQLERQLKDRGVTSDNRSETSGSKQQSSASERRLLDQLPRIIRLNNRLESLGLTVEVGNWRSINRRFLLKPFNRSSMTEAYLTEVVPSPATTHL